jgi:IclR family acetate operon transcriptional repressor
MRNTPRSETVGAVEKALALLVILKRKGRVRVVDVSRELDVAPSTAHRLLTTFERRGFVKQETDNAMYAIGPELIDLSTSIAHQLELATLIRPYLERLVGEIDETAHLCVLRGAMAYFLDCVECSHSIRAVSRRGRSIHAYATASGKALLAELSARDLGRILPQEDLPKITRKTIATRTALQVELRRTRERGYATNLSESELDFAAFAAVIRDRAGVARAAIVIAGPAARLKRIVDGRVVAALRATCADASAALS